MHTARCKTMTPLSFIIDTSINFLIENKTEMFKLRVIILFYLYYLLYD